MHEQKIRKFFQKIRIFFPQMFINFTHTTSVQDFKAIF